MTGRILLLHWNELCFPENITSNDLFFDLKWKERAEDALKAAVEAFRVRPDCRISFTKGIFHSDVAGRPFQSWLETWLGKDRFRQLRSKAVQPTSTLLPPVYEFDCELTLLGRSGEGITRAHISETWAWSFSCDEVGTEQATLQTQKTSIETNSVTQVEVQNLAIETHVAHWRDRLDVYGHTVSHNNLISEIGRYQIIMYPLDHGYPHIHVHVKDEPRVNVKYRVDVFEPLTSNRPDDLDQIMQTWVPEMQNQLLTSWDRCQRGAFPLKL